MIRPSAFILFLTLVFGFAGSAVTDDLGRFVLVRQSDSSANTDIYKLDTATGTVWKLNGIKGFKMVKFEGRTPSSGKEQGRYILFKQSIASKNRDLVLIDSLTGESWKYQRYKRSASTATHTPSGKRDFRRSKGVFKFLPEIE